MRRCDFLIKQLFFSITLFFVSISLTQAKTLDFFSYHWNENNTLLVFNYKAGDINALQAASLSFFAVDDCQKAYLGSYKIVPEQSFPIEPSKKFALLSDKTYQIAHSVIPEQETHNIHSVLIRFQGKAKELPRFLGACADQGSNCCVAIDCSNDAGICLAKYSAPQQAFVLFSEYN